MMDFCSGGKFIATLFNLMDYPIHIDKKCMDLSIVYFKGLPVKKIIK